MNKITTWRFYEGDNYSERSMELANKDVGMNSDKVREFVAKDDLQPFLDALDGAWGADERREATEALMRVWNNL